VSYARKYLENKEEENNNVLISMHRCSKPYGRIQSWLNEILMEFCEIHSRRMPWQSGLACC